MKRLSTWGYRGVQAHHKRQCFVVRIFRNQRQVYVGSYQSPHIAAAVADAAYDEIGDDGQRNFRPGFWESEEGKPLRTIAIRHVRG